MLLKSISNPENMRRVGANGCGRRKVGVRKRAAENCGSKYWTKVAEGVHDDNDEVLTTSHRSQGHA